MAMGAGGGMGMGITAHDGGCGGLAVTAPQGTLTEQQKATLAAMAQEEKLAHDLHTAFADKYPTVVFDRIAASETQHLRGTIMGGRAGHDAVSVRPALNGSRIR